MHQTKQNEIIRKHYYHKIGLYETFFMANSTAHEIDPNQKC